jgi:hypothetical protein
MKFTRAGTIYVVKNPHYLENYYKVDMTFNKDNSWKNEVDEFADIIRFDKKVLNGISGDALKVMELIKKILIIIYVQYLVKVWVRCF